MTKSTTFFAKKLVELRDQSGISRYELAKRSGITRQALALLEMGEREPNWDTVQRLSAALNVSCEVFGDPVVLQETEQEMSAPRRPRGRPPSDANAKQEQKAKQSPKDASPKRKK